MKGNLTEQDHIFSQGELKTAKIPEEKIDSIYNIRLIGSSENKIKSQTPYSEWIKSIGGNKEELKKHLRQTINEAIKDKEPDNPVYRVAKSKVMKDVVATDGIQRYILDPNTYHRNIGVRL